MTDVQRLIEALAGARVDFSIIGGVAMVLRGSARVTIDLDVCYSREADNLERLALALGPFRPRLRGAPPELPFLWDARTLGSGLNFTLTTEIGDLDLFGEVPGIGAFPAVAAGSSALEVGGRPVLVLDLDELARSKRAAGRAKDLLDLAELAEIRKRSKP